MFKNILTFFKSGLTATKDSLKEFVDAYKSNDDYRKGVKGYIVYCGIIIGICTVAVWIVKHCEDIANWFDDRIDGFRRFFGIKKKSEDEELEEFFN